MISTPKEDITYIIAPASPNIIPAALNLLNTGKDLYIIGSAGLVPGLQHIVNT